MSEASQRIAELESADKKLKREIARLKAQVSIDLCFLVRCDALMSTVRDMVHE
jgi:hypothetical protein